MMIVTAQAKKVSNCVVIVNFTILAISGVNYDPLRRY